MANVVKFKINGLSSALNNVYTRVTDLSRNELYSGETLVSDASGNVELDIGTAGSNGQGVIVYGDNYSAGNESTFKSFTGYGSILSLVDFTPITATKIIFLGASNSDGVFSGKADYCKLVLENYGVTSITDIIDASVGGRRVSEMLASGWEPIKSNHTGDPSVLVVMIDALGNDVSTLKPYATATSGNIDNVKATMQEIVDSVAGNGNTLLLFETTFRNYDVDGTMAIDDESLGSLPFLQDILYPISQTMQPDQWLPTENRPYASLYNWTFENALLTLADEVHYTTDGYELLRRLVLRIIASRLKGELPEIIPKVSAAVAKAKVATPQETLIFASNVAATGLSNTLAFANNWLFRAANNNVSLVSLDTLEPSSVTLTSSGTGMSYSTNSGIVDDGVHTPTLSNWRVRNAYGYTTSDVEFDLFTLKGFSPNQHVSVGMASYKDSTSSTVMKFTFNGSVSISCDSKNNSGTNVVYADVFADSNGEIAVKAQKTSGYAGYWNGCHVIV